MGKGRDSHQCPHNEVRLAKGDTGDCPSVSLAAHPWPAKRLKMQNEGQESITSPIFRL
jgi:hypothetical protein